MQKLYCYVDEAGQDTKGKLFVVAVVITAADRDALRHLLEAIDERSGKGRRKWHHTKPPRRRAYIQAVLAEPRCKGALHYALYRGTTDYPPSPCVPSPAP
jgi:hypothetical protein